MHLSDAYLKDFAKVLNQFDGHGVRSYALPMGKGSRKLWHKLFCCIFVADIVSKTQCKAATCACNVEKSLGMFNV